MKVIRNIAELRLCLEEVRKQGKTIGLVPTMGALHQGHLSLVELAKKNSDICVMSLFVNPMQFNKQQDFIAYPRTETGDLQLAEKYGVELVFAPSAEEIYAVSDGSIVKAGKAAVGYEGEFRPGHFDGVATVIAVLFNIVQPQVAAFGEKDFQQVKVVKELVAALHYPVEIIVGATIREKDGLALSSRNLRLNDAQRERASSIPKALLLMQAKVQGGELSVAKLTSAAAQQIQQADLGLEYLVVLDSATFKPLERVVDGARVLVAANVDDVRLIDNMQLK